MVHKKTHPRGEDDPGIEGQGFGLHRVHIENTGVDEPLVNGAALDQAALGKAPITSGQFRVAFQQVFEVAVQEAVAPHAGQYGLQVETFVFDSDGAALGRAQETVHQGFVFAKQQGDDRLLVGEVVVQVARRNFHMGGNMVGAHTALTLLVKKLQAGLHNALAGLYSWCHRGSASVHVMGHLTAYSRRDKSACRRNDI